MKSLNISGLWARGSWYVLRNAIGPISYTFIFTVLLLESVRLKLVWNVAVHQTHPFWAIAKYLGQWLPLYSALGLQVALAVGTMMGFTKISRSRELDALHAVGFSMIQLIAPLLGLTTLFATISFFIFGWLQPLSLYNSGLFIHEVQMTASLLTDGQNLFRVEGDKTIVVDGIDRDGRGFNKVFIYQTYPTGDSVTTAGSAGQILGEGSISKQSYAVNALDVMQMKGDGALPLSTQTAATTATRLSGVKGPINAIDDKPYRARGAGVFEWTIDELFKGQVSTPNDVKPNQVSAELNYRIALLVFIMLLPFIAIATIVEPRRNPGPFRFFIGLLIVLGFNQYLSIGSNFSRANVMPPIITIWLPLLVLIILVAWRFWKISYRPAFKTAR